MTQKYKWIIPACGFSIVLFEILPFGRDMTKEPNENATWRQLHARWRILIQQQSRPRLAAKRSRCIHEDPLASEDMRHHGLSNHQLATVRQPSLYSYSTTVRRWQTGPPRIGIISMKASRQIISAGAGCSPSVEMARMPNLCASTVRLRTNFYS